MNFPSTYELTESQKELMATMQNGVEAWLKGDEVATETIEDILDSFPYSILPYACRNESFITSSKLKMYQQNPFFAKMMYKDLIPSCKEDQSHFDIGIAVDRRLTYGENDYAARFIIKNRPTQEMQLMAAEQHKVILTESEGKTVDRCVAEYLDRPFFIKKPLKTNFLAIIDGLPCKAEVDHWGDGECAFEDVKTCANINTFDPNFYKVQMSFYYLVITRHAEKKLKDTDYEDLKRKLTGSLNVADKNSAFSRSHKFIYTNETLQENVPMIMELISKWKDSEESGIWPWKLDFIDPSDLETFFNSDFYPICKEQKDNMQPTYL